MDSFIGRICRFQLTVAGVEYECQAFKQFDICLKIHNLDERQS